MRNRTKNDARERLRKSLSSNQLYVLLRSVCPTFERNLQSVRPSAEEVMQEAVTIFDELISTDANAAATYCRGLWNDVYCQWRDATETANRIPKDEELNQTVAIVLYVVYIMLTLMGEPQLMSLASIIEVDADKNSRESWQKAEKAFLPNLAIVLRDGLANWIKEYADNEKSLFDKDGMIFDTELTGAKQKQNFTANQYVIFAIYLFQKAGFDIHHNLTKVEIARFLAACTNLKEDTFTQKLKVFCCDDNRTKIDMQIVANFLEDWLPSVSEQIRRDMNS